MLTGQGLDHGRIKGGAAHQVFDLDLFIWGVGKVLVAGSKTDGGNAMQARCIGKPPGCLGCLYQLRIGLYSANFTREASP